MPPEDPVILIVGLGLLLAVFTSIAVLVFAKKRRDDERRWASVQELYPSLSLVEEDVDMLARALRFVAPRGFELPSIFARVRARGVIDGYGIRLGTTAVRSGESHRLSNWVEVTCRGEGFPGRFNVQPRSLSTHGAREDSVPLKTGSLDASVTLRAEDAPTAQRLLEEPSVQAELLSLFEARGQREREVSVDWDGRVGLIDYEGPDDGFRTGMRVALTLAKALDRLFAR